VDKQVTLTIPDYVYRQAERIAKNEVRSPTEVLSDALVQVFPAIYVHPRQDEMLIEQAAFQAMLKELLIRYNGEYVAVNSGQVVDHDSDMEVLIERINEQYPEEIVLIKKVTPEPDQMIQMRSPRFIR
jgi:hypothetical protein